MMLHLHYINLNAVYDVGALHAHKCFVLLQNIYYFEHLMAASD